MVYTSSLAYFIGALAVIATSIWVYFKFAWSYWSRKNVPIPHGNPKFPVGHLGNTKKQMGFVLQDFYEEMKAKQEKFFGLYVLNNPWFVPVGLDLIKLIMTKDFDHFVDRGAYYNEEDDPISAHLLSIGGTKWKNLRIKLSPTFTSGKLKTMFPILLDCGKMLTKSVNKIIDSGDPIDTKELLSCFTIDIIGSCAFGLNCNTFEDPESPFLLYSKKVFDVDVWRYIKLQFVTLYPNLAKKLHIKRIPQDISRFFYKMVEETIEYRQKNNTIRKDFIQILIDLNKDLQNGDIQGAHDGKSLSFDEMVAQSFVFFLAGYETSSTALTFALYELSKNFEIQEKARKEVNEILAKYNGEMTYEAILEMKYINQILDETLRMYPPITTITRACVKDYNIPSTKTSIEKGTIVLIPVLAIHYDGEYFPVPQKFDPERFSEENRRNMNPYTHIPFGEGPRICIGQRMGVMQFKVGLATFLKSFKFTLNKKTKEPIEFDPKALILIPSHGVWLSAEKI